MKMVLLEAFNLIHQVLDRIVYRTFTLNRVPFLAFELLSIYNILQVLWLWRTKSY